MFDGSGGLGLDRHGGLFRLDLDQILALTDGRAGLDKNPDHGGLLDSLPHVGDAEFHGNTSVPSSKFQVPSSKFQDSFPTWNLKLGTWN